MNTADRNPPVARLEGVSLHYRHATALADITLTIPSRGMVSLIGPDGVGKSSLLALLAGARVVQTGTVTVLGGDMSDAGHRRTVGPDIAYMPQGLGKNLYPTLSVEENLQFFGRLFGHSADERRRRIHELTRATGLYPFLDRPAGKLSGGMKQKVGLCCALIHDPELLILDEPTTGVDPLARRQFWDLIDHIRSRHDGMSVIVATAYMDEASRFDWLVAMDEGKVLATGAPDELMRRTGTVSPEAAFIALMAEHKRHGHAEPVIPPLKIDPNAPPAIQARGLTRRFGDFTAVDHVNFEIRRGEIFGFLGSNGCGKTTTMKMLTGLLPATEGESLLFGHSVDPRDLDTRKRVGYMSQSFSLYPELTVGQNLILHARLFQVPEEAIESRVEEMIDRFGLRESINILPRDLPMGMRQRLSLAVAVVHSPEMLILDEPTSGVDPIARDGFWELLIDLSRRDGVTIFISTHFMNEGERCDRVSLMHAGKVLVSDAPDEIARRRGVESLEEAFIRHLEDAGVTDESTGLRATSVAAPTVSTEQDQPARRRHRLPGFSLRRAFSYTLLEALELARDPIRGTMALLGSVILLFIIGYGITMDVDDLTFAVLDRDQTGISNRYRMNLSGSRYFIERDLIRDYDELDARMRSGELSLAIEIPAGFGRDVQRGAPVQIGAWVDGAMPSRAETIQGYVRGIHQQWLTDVAGEHPGRTPAGAVSVETRFRYNPDIESLHAIVPAVIPLLLLLIPAMLTALSVVREKEMGSIINLYVTPVTRAEFLLGKQLPYVALGMVNYLLLMVLAFVVFGVSITGSFLALTVASLVFLLFSTGCGLLCSAFTRTQIAALFVTILLTMIPATQYAGLLIPVSSLEGAGGAFGRVYPVTHLLIISRGVFSKGLGMGDLQGSFWPVIVSVPVIWMLAAAFLRKQEK